MFGAFKFRSQVNTGIVSLGLPVNSVSSDLRRFIKEVSRTGEFNPAETAVIVASKIPGAFHVLVDDVLVDWKRTQRIDTFKPAVSEALQSLGHSIFSHVPGFC